VRERERWGVKWEIRDWFARVRMPTLRFGLLDLLEITTRPMPLRISTTSTALYGPQHPNQQLKPIRAAIEITCTIYAHYHSPLHNTPCHPDRLNDPKPTQAKPIHIEASSSHLALDCRNLACRFFAGARETMAAFVGSLVSLITSETRYEVWVKGRGGYLACVKAGVGS